MISEKFLIMEFLCLKSTAKRNQNTVKTVVSMQEFQLLFDTAIAKLRDYPSDNDMQQVVVIQFWNEKIYNTVIPDVTQNGETETDKQIAEILNASDVIIKRILCVWKDGTIDLPSFRFRQKLYRQNEKNGNAAILLKGQNTYCIKTLKETLS